MSGLFYFVWEGVHKTTWQECYQAVFREKIIAPEGTANGFGGRLVAIVNDRA
ncbi:MAG: hypothetical protein LZF61_10205 [Nitrosomonas sp.]|nr:MAG: hypothetical protein LZF61_10205 [Nitrosomonas sp.]